MRTGRFSVVARTVGAPDAGSGVPEVSARSPRGGVASADVGMADLQFHVAGRDLVSGRRGVVAATRDRARQAYRASRGQRERENGRTVPSCEPTPTATSVDPGARSSIPAGVGSGKYDPCPSPLAASSGPLVYTATQQYATEL